MTEHDEPCEGIRPGGRSAGDHRLRGSTAGSATAELVVLLPAVGALLVAILAGVQAVVADAAVVDAAATAARLVTRGDDAAPALDRFAASGRAAEWSQRREGDFVCVTVRLESRPATLLSFPAEAESCALAAE